jgi:hypothetical protein
MRHPPRRNLGALTGRAVVIMGAAYRFDSEDTRNSPSLVLARLLLDRGCEVAIHDPYVKPDDQNLTRLGLDGCFTRDAGRALSAADVAFFCTAHGVYAEQGAELLGAAPRLRGVVDACNLFRRDGFSVPGIGYSGIGRGRRPSPPGFAGFVLEGFRVMEHGLANELAGLVEFLNERYAEGDFNRVAFEEVRRIAGTCVTGCSIARPQALLRATSWQGFTPRLAALAAGS